MCAQIEKKEKKHFMNMHYYLKNILYFKEYCLTFSSKYRFATLKLGELLTRLSVY